MNLALVFIIAGVVLLAGVYVALRYRPQTAPPASGPPVPVSLASTTDAILLASGYGRIAFANRHARDWFSLDDSEPDLELLATQVRPADAFRDLFAAEGRAMLQVGQRRVEAASYALPGETGRYQVVILRDTASARTVYGPDTARALTTLGEIGQRIGDGTPLPDTLNAILATLRRAIPFDAGQVLIASAEGQPLRSLAAVGERAILQALERQAREGQGNSNWIMTYREPLLVERAPDSGAGREAPLFESYIGAPLRIGGQFIGVLQVVRAEPEAFDFDDLSLLSAAADQTAAAIDRAWLLDEKIARARELAGLQAIIQVAAGAADREALFAALTRQVAEAMDVELCGVFVYDPAGARLVAAPPFYGVPEAAVAAARYSLAEGSLTRRAWLRDEGWYANDLREGGLIDSLGWRDHAAAMGLRTLALMPLLVGRRRVGLILLGNRRGGQLFGPAELQRLRLFAAQTAVIVEAAALAERDRRRHRELGALQSFSLAVGRAGEAEAVFRAAAEQITALLGAEMGGVLLLDDRVSVLAAHPTFYGVDPALIDSVHLPVPAGSKLAGLWAAEGWLCNDLSQDPVAQEAGLEQLADWVGMRQMLLAPLIVSGRPIGALLVSNKRDGSGFTPDDARLANIFAAQVAVIQANSRLQAEAQAQATEARVLGELAERLASPASLDALVGETLAAVTRLFDSPVALVDLWDEIGGALRVEPEHVRGAALSQPLLLPEATPFEQPLLSNDLLRESGLPIAYRPLIEQLGLRKALIAPLRGGSQTLGDLVVANRGRADYSPTELRTLTLIAAQLSAAVERQRLATMTDQALQARLAELEALGRVSNALGLSVELEHILQVIRQEATRVTGAECTILMLAPQEDWADLDQPEIMRRHGAEDRLTEIASVERMVLESGEVVRIPDYAAVALAPAPAGAASALIVPVQYSGRVVGAIHVFAGAPGAFDSRTEDFLTALALKASTAYANAAHFREQISRNQLLSRRVEQLNQVFELGQVIRAGRNVDELLEAVAHAVQSAAGYAVVLISLYDETVDGFRRTAQAGIPLATFEAMRGVVLRRSRIEGLLQEKFRISHSYFFPAERAAEWRPFLTDEEIVYHREYVQDEQVSALWQPDDALVVPLRDTQGGLLGIMTVDAPLDGRRPTAATLEPLEIFAQQAAIGVENARLLEVIQREAQVARRDRDLMERLYAVSTQIQQALDVPSRLQVVAQGIQNAGWRHVSITLRDANLDPTTLIAVGYTEAELDVLQASLESGRQLRAWLDDPLFYETRVGAAFYLRYDAPWVIQNLRGGQPPDPAEAVPAGRWHPADRILLPVYGAENRLIGLIGMADPADGRAPTEDSLRPIQLFASQAASAIELTRLYQETSRAAEQEALFNQMMQAVTGTLDVEQIIQAVAEGLQHFLLFTHMSVALYNTADDRFDLLEANFVAVDRVEVQPGESVPAVGTALSAVREANRGQVRFAPASLEPSLEPDVRQWWEGGERSTMLIPMPAGGEVIGVLHLGSENQRAFGFDEATMALVQRMTNLASVTIANARLYQRTVEREQFSAALVRLGNELNATLDLSAILASICQESLAILEVDGAYIWQAERDELVGIAGVGPASDRFVGLRIPQADDRLLASRVFATREPLSVNRFAEQEAIRIALAEEITARAVMGVPLLREGHALGVLVVARTASDRPFTADSLERAAIFATQASIAVQNARLYQDMRDLQGYTSAIIESIQQGIVVLDRAGRITLFNSAMRRAYGWGPEATGQPLTAYRPELAALLAEAMGAVLAEGEPRLVYNAPARTVSGQAVIQNLYLYPLQQGSEVAGLVLLVDDVTERAQLEADLERRAEQLAALTDISSRLTATLEPDDVIRLVLDQLGRVVAYDGVTLWLREGDALRVAAIRGYSDGAGEPIGQTTAIADSSLFMEMTTRQQALNVLDMTRDPRFPPEMRRGMRSWLGAPLVSKGEMIGLLALDKAEPVYYTTADEQLILAFANQATVALENARLFAEARRRTQELTQQTARLSLLNRVSTKLAQSLDIENIFEVALQESMQALGATSARALLFDLELHIASVLIAVPRGDAPPTEVIPLSDPALAHLRHTFQPLVVADVREEPLLAGMQARLVERGVTALMLLPLQVGRQVIGALMLEAAGEPRAFTPEQVELAGTIAGQAAIAVQNANLLEQSFVRTRELETLLEASQVMSLTLELGEVTRSVATQVAYALEADRCAVMLWDDVEQSLVVSADVRREGDAILPAAAEAVWPLENYPARRQALESRAAILVRQGEAEHPHERTDMAAQGCAIRALVPLVVRENAIGLIQIDINDKYRSFGLREQRIARTLAGQAAIAIENARLNSETAAQVQEAFLINDLSRAVSAAVDMRELLPIVRSQIPALTRAGWLYLAIYDQEHDVLSFPVAIRDGVEHPLEARPLANDEFSWIVRNNRPLLLVGDDLAEVRRNLEIETLLPEARSLLGVPLSVGSSAVGVLVVADAQRTRAFGLSEQRVLTTVANQLAVAVQNTNLFSELRRLTLDLEMRVHERTEELRAERDRLNVLYRMTAELSATLDLDRVLNRALSLLAGAVGADQGLIMLIDHAQSRLYKRAELGAEFASAGMDAGLRLDEGLAGWVIQNRESVVIDDVQGDPRWVVTAPHHREPRGTLAVLLETSDDVLGVLLLYSVRPGAFNQDHLRLAIAAGNQLATSINNAELYLFIREQAERLGDMVREQQVEASKSNAVLEGVADGVMFANEFGEITLFNNAAERVLNLRRQDVIGRSIRTLTGLYGGGGRRWAERIEAWMREPGDIRPGEYFSETLELGERVVNVTLAPVNLGDQFLGTVSVFRDITRDVEVDRMKTEFISNVSHELRTPLTSIKGYADLLVKGAAGQVSDLQMNFLTTIKNNADRLNRLVDDLLNISRIDSGRVALDLRPVQLDLLAREVFNNLRGRCASEGKALTLVDDIPDDLPITYADPDKLTQILTNLTDNAYRYTPEGGKITLSIRLEDGRFLIAVQDTGIGIPEEVQARVFERFFRYSEHPLVIETPGTGLGLALTRELVEMHHGTIWLESAVGQGSTFFVSLPLVEAPPADDAGL